MAKKKSKPQAKKPVKKHVFKDPTVEEIVEVEVEFTCPIRGRIKQKVKVKRLKKIVDGGPKRFVGASSVIDDLEKEENERLLSLDPEPEE